MKSQIPLSCKGDKEMVAILHKVKIQTLSEDH